MRLSGRDVHMEGIEGESHVECPSTASAPGWLLGSAKRLCLRIDVEVSQRACQNRGRPQLAQGRRPDGGYMCELRGEDDVADLQLDRGGIAFRRVAKPAVHLRSGWKSDPEHTLGETKLRQVSGATFPRPNLPRRRPAVTPESILTLGLSHLILGPNTGHGMDDVWFRRLTGSHANHQLKPSQSRERIGSASESECR